ncbi:nicotinate-nucleotide adenylyltransferase [Pacificimonas sp. WHA3]|uniref:Probable nicotinate-nucleotide adenylyltransferase n=1 Tax=Pacificimonas pallii TaxID=2827236 RepID=A0ABS6SDB0_9SPHN|nr:nicotinate-nucleotide adenylyltransferase [Pacificimonas pallii]MBV7256393.1 nicotinate-nucleotide adenylyltransferase [Pacificimonas pallii]
MSRIGILGGSFNPAHGGHRHISLQAIDKLGLDEVWWLVSPQNPLKPATEMAPLEARLASAKGMARRAPIRPLALETELGTRYSVDTAREMLRRYPQHDFIWLMGSDNLAQLHRWKDWRKLAHSLPIAVLARRAYLGSARRAPAMGWLRRFQKRRAHARQWRNWSPPAIVLLNIPLDPTSATAIRARNPDWAARYLSSPSATDKD